MRPGAALRTAGVVVAFAALRPGPVALLPPPSTVEVAVGADGSAMLRTASAEFHVGRGGCIEARLLEGNRRLSLDEADDSGDCVSSVTVDGGKMSGLVLDFQRAWVSDVNAVDGGPGRRIEIPGGLASGDAPSVEVTMTLEVLDPSPNAVSTMLAYRNAGEDAVTLGSVSLPERRLSASRVDPASAPHPLWSFHGSSEHVGRDEVVSLAPGFARTNTLGAPGHRGVGGGIPVVAFWSASVGTALGHLEPAALSASVPVEVSADGRVHATVRLEPRARLGPGEVFRTPRLFHSVFAGDYYEALRIYARLVEAGGQPTHSPSPGSYEPSWCSWGFGEDVTLVRMLGALPKLEDLGIRWAALDDRWFDAFGDWRPRAEAFPGDSIRHVVKAYHARGLKLQIWWVPLAVEAGDALPRGTRHRTADVAARHPDWLVLDESGLPARTVRGLRVLCPAVPEVREHHRRLVRRFIGEWGFDGHKLDAAFTVPRCHNPRHRHRSPDDSLSALGVLYQEILSETRALKADAVVQICPCGTAPHHAWLPFLTQAVAADPWGSAQRRQRIKMYKALLGPAAAVSGDHVELAEGRSAVGGESARGQDFASTLGLGGVLSTRFVWPEGPPGSEDALLTDEREALFRKWLAVDRRTRLSQGTFRNLYVHGFDRPEGYCIEKDGQLYYAFFTADPGEVFDGALELRGLGPRRYRVDDYGRGRRLGVVAGPRGRLNARFKGYLLLVASAGA
jgi:alpha-galactosidase